MGLLAGALVAGPAHAGIYTDDLARCLVTKSTEADKTLLMRWMFGALGASPATRDLAAISPAQSDQLSKQGAELFGRLLTDTCHGETVAAMKYEGSGAIETAFSTLGQVAARGLMTDPSVAAELAKLDKYLDKDKLTALGKEAGMMPPAQPAKH